MKLLISVVLLFISTVSIAQDTTPDELRGMIVDSIILDLQDLISTQESNRQAISLTHKVKALIESYESSLNAHRKVMHNLKNQLDENNIFVRID